MNENRVAVGMSGGKDSSAAVMLLKKAGYEVLGVTMAMGLAGDQERIERLKVLCSVLGVPLQVVELSALFDRFVRQPFSAAYLADQTPNPCALCNREIKFGRFMKKALEITGAGYFATGHYAAKATVDGRQFLCEPLETRKTQIYFLALIEPLALERVLFPLAAISLDTVRAMTRDLPLVNKEESQDVCFLAGEKLSTYLARELAQEDRQDGDIIDTSGQKIGRHHGLGHYTIGQRRGIGYAGGQRLYVVNKNSRDNVLVLGQEQDLQKKKIVTILPVYWRPIQPGEQVMVKIRYQTPARPALVESANEQGFTLVLDEPISAVTPGQIAVLYQGNFLVAGAEIMAV